MSKVSRPDTTVSMLRDILARLRKLETAPRLTSASIRGGVLRVYNRLGGTALFMGQTTQDCEFILRREDTSVAFAVYNGGGGVGADQFVAMFDRNGNIICSDDTTSGVGHARPWIPIPMTPTLNFSTADSTNSTSYTDMVWLTFYKQQPKADVLVWVATDASTSGSVQLWDIDNGVQVGAPVAIGTNVSYIPAEWVAAVSGNYGDRRSFSVRGKVNAGSTGSIRVLPGAAYSRQS